MPDPTKLIVLSSDMGRDDKSYSQGLAGQGFSGGDFNEWARGAGNRALDDLNAPKPAAQTAPLFEASKASPVVLPAPSAGPAPGPIRPQPTSQARSHSSGGGGASTIGVGDFIGGVFRFLAKVVVIALVVAIGLVAVGRRHEQRQASSHASAPPTAAKAPVADKPTPKPYAPPPARTPPPAKTPAPRAHAPSAQSETLDEMRALTDELKRLNRERGERSAPTR